MTRTLPQEMENGHRNTLRNLISAVIAVNNFSLDEAIQLTDPTRPLNWSCSDDITDFTATAFEIKTQIMESGYRKGDYVALLLGQRIEKLLKEIISRGSTSYLNKISIDESFALKNLATLPGVGPKVTHNFIRLQFGESPQDVNNP